MIYNQSATTDELARKTSRPSGAGFSFARYVLPRRSTLLERSVGDELLNLAPATYFVVPVDIPAIGQVHAARPGSPYLAMSLILDPATIASLVDGCDDRISGSASGLAVSTAPAELIDACLRMMRLKDRPGEVAVLAPLIEREILFRILQGPQGNILRHIAREESRLSQIRRAIDWIRSHYTEPFRVEPLAAMAGMSVAALLPTFQGGHWYDPDPVSEEAPPSEGAAAADIRTPRCRGDRVLRRL